VDTDYVVHSACELFRCYVLVVALVGVEGVDGRATEDGKLIEELERNDCEHVGHHELPKFGTDQWVLEHLVAKVREHDEERDHVGIHDEIEDDEDDDDRHASAEDACLGQPKDSVVLQLRPLEPKHVVVLLLEVDEQQMVDVVVPEK